MCYHWSITSENSFYRNDFGLNLRITSPSCEGAMVVRLKLNIECWGVEGGGQCWLVDFIKNGSFVQNGGKRVGALEFWIFLLKIDTLERLHTKYFTIQWITSVNFKLRNVKCQKTGFTRAIHSLKTKGNEYFFL